MEIKRFWNLRWCLHDAFFIYEMKSIFCFYVVYSVNPDFFAEVVPFRALEWAIPRRREFRGMNIFFRGITKTVPSLSAEFFRNGISMATLGLIKKREKYIEFQLPLQ